MKFFFVFMVVCLFSGQAMAAGPKEARDFIKRLDAAVAEGRKIVKPGVQTKDIANHSRKMQELVAEGEERFGKFEFSQPYGYCTSAAGQANAIWMDTYSPSHHNPEGMKLTIRIFKEKKKDCLDMARKVETGKWPEKEEEGLDGEAHPF